MRYCVVKGYTEEKSLSGVNELLVTSLVSVFNNVLTPYSIDTHFEASTTDSL